MNVNVNRNRKLRIRAMAIFIVFLALAATIMESTKSKTVSASMDFRHSNSDYDNLRFINKAKVAFSTNETGKAQEEIAAIMKAVGERQIRKQDESQSGAYIFTVKSDKVPEIIDELRKIGTVGSKIEQIDTALVNIDYESESKKLKSYESELSDLGNVRFPSDVQNRRKEELHTLIQHVRNNLEKLRESDNTLLYIMLNSASVKRNQVGQYSSSIGVYGKWLIIFFVGAVLVYFGANLLNYFLALLGVRASTERGYGAYSAYYNRYTSNKKKRRKTKRIYKDKDANNQTKPTDPN